MAYDELIDDLQSGADLQEISAFELFFGDGEVTEGNDGLIWKDILREGEWAYRPGSGQKPTAVPLKIVAGKSSKSGEISMAELVEAFNDNAIDHVTVPTSHDDKPHENTGFVKALRIEERDGKKVLRAGIHFTEEDVKGKAMRGSIANTSAGIIFNYIKKDNGKSYSQALGHVALTNKPWINGMKPFGVLASEEFSDLSDDDITPLLLENVVWDSKKSLLWVRDQVSRALAQDKGEGFYVADVMPNRALVTAFDTNSRENINYVVPFQIRGDSVKISNDSKWIKATKEWVETAMSEQKDFSKDFDSASALSEEAPDRAGRSDPETGGNNMGSANKEEEGTPTSGATSGDPAPAVELSEEAANKLREQIRAELSEETSDVVEENKALRKIVRGLAVDKRVNELKEMGFSNQPGLLAEFRNIMLADEGKPALLLSEEEDGEAKTVSLTASDIVDRIINAMPRKDGRIDFGEQALEVDSGDPPSEKTETDLSEDEKIKNLAEGLGITLPTSNKDGDA